MTATLTPSPAQITAGLRGYLTIAMERARKRGDYAKADTLRELIAEMDEVEKESEEEAHDTP